MHHADDNEKLARVYSSSNPQQAHLARNWLEQHGLTARVTGDGLAHSGLPGVANVDVSTPESQATEALRLLEDWEQT